MSSVRVGRIVLPQSGALSKARALKGASKKNWPTAEAAPGGRGLGEHGGPATESPDSTEPPVGLKSTDRRIWPRPFSLPSGQAAHGVAAWAHPAPPPRSPPRPGPPRATRRCQTARRRAGAIRPSLESAARAVLLTLPWPAASLAPRPGRCRYR